MLFPAFITLKFGLMVNPLDLHSDFNSHKLKLFIVVERDTAPMVTTQTGLVTLVDLGYCIYVIFSCCGSLINSNVMIEKIS